MSARPVRLLGLAAVLLTAVPAAAFPKLPPVKLPPVKLPPSPVIRDLLPYAPGVVVVPGGSGSAPVGHPLKAALKEVRSAKDELADKQHLHLAQTTQRVKAAEALVGQVHKVAVADKKAKRAERLDGVLKDLQAAHRHIADHQVDRAHDALQKAAHELTQLTQDPKAGTAK